MRPEYRIFVDESGDDCTKNFTNKNSEFLCLTGVIIKEDYCQSITIDINSIKQSYFNIDTATKNYPLHRNEILKCTPPFNKLKDDNWRSSFNRDWLNNLNNWNFTITSVLIDKKKLLKKYSKPFNPYRFGFALLMERYLIFLQQNNAKGDIMVESISKTHDKNLKKTYSYLYFNDMPQFKLSCKEFQQYFTSCELKMKKKNMCVCGLELSDMLVSAMKKKILKEYYPDKELKCSFDDNVLLAINNKILKGNNGRGINGIGIKVFP